MAVRLLSLTFNHDTGSSRNSALNLRIDATEAVEIPEWKSGRLKQFPAAYSIQDVAGATVLIEATLIGPPNSALEVTAVPSPLGGTHVLGPVTPQTVGFGAGGSSGTVRFQLASPSFVFAGVRSHTVSWRWLQRSAPLDGWAPFAETSHQIFTVLRTPTLPWVQEPFARFNTQLPWADVLDVACRWAALTFDPAKAATAITAALFSLGGDRFRYNCLSGAPSNYSSEAFDCSAFLERLSGGFGRGPNVNCSDCATIVSTFANAVGADLSQARMFNQVTPFTTNPLRLIGQPFFGSVCGTGLFNYHEVAWGGLCTELDEVYDGSVQLPAPAPPFTAVATVIPSNMLFGFRNQGLYRDLLASPLGRSICQPQPALSRMRRQVF